MAFVKGDVFYGDQAGERELRICFTSVPPNRADDVVKRLLRAIAAAKRDASAPANLVAIV
jgi:DNA-binding transcriptional MocR family regulator